MLADHPRLTLTGLYNVLEELRAGTHPEALSPASRRIFEDGLVLILKELHDRLDTAVAAAYGWPTDLDDNEILTRLVALNRERAEEESSGLVRWLRPDYQIPRFGSVAEKTELRLVGGGTRPQSAAPATGPKPLFPTDNVAQTAAIMARLSSASGPIDTATIAADFRQGRRIGPQVSAVLTALARMGYVTTPDAGRTFVLRRVA